MRSLKRNFLAAIAAAGLGCSAVAMIPVDDLKLEASDPVTGDEFGSSVSVLGGWSVIGAPRDNIFGANSGSAYLFAKGASGQWFESQKITPSDATSTANFGGAVAMGDGYCVVGAPVHPTNGLFRAGSAYIFEYDGQSWSESAQLIPNDLVTKDRMGTSVAASGDVVVVGASGDGIFDFVNGKAYVYRRLATGAWSLEQTLRASDAAQNDHFGASVAIDGDRIVVGADRDDDGGSSSGSAYVFERQGNGNWAQVAKLTALDGAGGDQFGNDVAISGDVVAVAAFRDDEGSMTNTGSVRMFRRNAGAWAPAGKLDAGQDTLAYNVFGSSVSMVGSTVFVGMPTEANPLVSPGMVFAFEEAIGAAWVRTLTLEPDDGEAGDFFGDAVAFDGQRAIAGARWDDTTKENAGSATVYSFVEECVGDLNGDGARDTADLGLMIGVFGQADIATDLNGDGIVDTADLGVLISVFGTDCP